MKHLSLDAIMAFSQVPKYSRLASGTAIRLPGGEEAKLQVVDLRRSYQLEGLRLFEFGYTAKARIGSHVAIGFGEANSRLVAIQKAISESVERALFLHFCESSSLSSNSNGWAAHVSSKKAEQAALFELLERDAPLVHFLSKTSFYEIDINSVPKWLQRWKEKHLSKSPFPRLRILLSHLGHVPTVSTVLLNSSGNAVVSHGFSKTLEDSLVRALGETCRIAKIASSLEYIDSSKKLLTNIENDKRIGPCEQAVVYAHHIPFPTWTFGKLTEWKIARSIWVEKMTEFHKSNFRYRFHEIISDPLAVGYCESNLVQGLFFGKAQDARNSNAINAQRLQNIMQKGEQLNTFPHFVA